MYMHIYIYIYINNNNNTKHNTNNNINNNDNTNNTSCLTNQLYDIHGYALCVCICNYISVVVSIHLISCYYYY